LPVKLTHALEGCQRNLPAPPLNIRCFPTLINAMIRGP